MKPRPYSSSRPRGAGNKDYTIKVYEGVGHGFMNESPEPYANETAKDEGFEAIGFDKTFYPYDADVANAAWGSLFDFFEGPLSTRPTLLCSPLAAPSPCLPVYPPARSLLKILAYPSGCGRGRWSRSHSRRWMLSLAACHTMVIAVRLAENLVG